MCDLIECDVEGFVEFFLSVSAGASDWLFVANLLRLA